MRQSITNFFIFTKRERIGITALVTFILLLLVGRGILRNHVNRDYDYSEIENQLAHLILKQDSVLSGDKPASKKTNRKVIDPNHATLEDWQQLGFSQKQANVILKYKNKGAVFKEKKDLLKLFVIDEKKLIEISAYIHIETTSKEQSNKEPIAEVKSTSKQYASRGNKKTIDPNTATVSDWMQLGFSQKQAKVILKYKDKGAIFKKKEDLLKLFVIDKKKLKEISPYLLIKPKKIEETERAANIDSFELAYESINVNTADTTALIAIKYIGSYYAKSIVKYRNMLGGFYNKEQFAEIYGLQDNQKSLEALSKYVWIDKHSIKKININTVEAKQLAKHHYIKWSTANALVKYRKMHGKFQTIEEITKCDLVTDELYSKIAPYLKLHDN